MKVYIRTNADAHLFRAKHEKAHFMLIGAFTTMHKLTTIVATVFLGLSMFAASAVWCGVSPTVALYIILAICATLFALTCYAMIATGRLALVMFSATRISDLPEFSAAGIFTIKRKPQAR